MMKRNLIIVILMVIITTVPAFAQLYEQEWSVGVFGSLKKLVGDDVDYDMVNPWFGATIGYTPTPRLTYTLSGAYGWTYPLDGTKTGFMKHFAKAVDTPYKTDLIPIFGNVRYNFIPDSKLNPYLEWGIGLLMWNLKEDGTSVHGTKLHGLFNAGLGLQMFLAEAIALDLSGWYHHILLQHNDMTGLDDKQTGALELRLGLSFLFGGLKDKDGDGIKDKVDKDPNKPEDFDGFQDEDGAPDLDNDGDGILDAQDKAPNQAEDKDGFQDADGIPDPDNDGDGILDVKDKAPNEPETFNGYEDEDGAPDKKPEVVIELKAPIVLEGVTFLTGSATLSESAKGVLDKVVRTMVDYPDMVVEVRGHTDNVGKKASNLLLSQRRADSVKAYLVSKGIDAERLEAKGFGQDSPIASNDTPQGRNTNRRIEFIRLK